MASGQEALAPVAIAIPLITAATVAAIGRYVPRRLVDSMSAGATAAVVGILGALVALTGDGRVVTWAGGWTPKGGTSVGIVLVVDNLGAGIGLVAAVLVLAALIYSWHYFESSESTYHVLMLCFLAGMTGFSLTGDLFDMFVFFELMGVVAYALTGYKIEEAQSVHGALSFALINSLGAYVTLTGVALLYARTGELGLAQIGVKLAGKPADALVVAGFVFAITGFIVKAALVPFHFWLADAHAVAPTPVCVLMSGVMVELGLYGMARVYWVVASGTIPGPDFRRAFIVFGTVTAILGAVMCVAQRHLKRLLAFSTISHVGLFCVGIAVLAPEALGGSAIYVVGHAGVKSALFLLTGMLINRYKTVDEGELHGRGRESLSLGVLWMVGGLGLAGLPPFALALGKGLEEHAATTIGYLYTPALFTLASALTGAAVLRAGFRVYFGYGVRAGQRMPGPQMTGPQISGEGQPGQLAAAHEEPETGREVERVPVTMVIPAVALIAGAFALGLYPGFAQACANAAAAFVDRAGYAAHALYTGTPVQPKAAPVQPWTVEGVLLGITSAVLAVGLAAASVWAYRLPRGFITWIRKGEPALRWLHRQHSGHVGDYVAWVVAGVAILAAFIGLPLAH